jgi:SAM-dependent methyltransferase
MGSHDDWDDHWERFATSASRNPAQRMRHTIIQRLLERVSAGQPERILDIGSGQGDLIVKLSQHFPEARFVGFEMSQRGVEISREKVPDATFEVVDVFEPPPDAGKFRGWATQAVCSEVLEHVDSPEKLLAAAASYLAPEARVIVTVPGGPMSAFDRHIGHRQHFTKDSIRSVLEEAGFAVECVWLSGFPFFNLYRALVIARGEKLTADVESKNHGFGANLANVAMGLFRLLFEFNLWNSPWGWQVVAIARKTVTA